MGVVGNVADERHTNALSGSGKMDRAKEGDGDGQGDRETLPGTTAEALRRRNGAGLEGQ